MLMATTPFPHRYSVTLIADELAEGPRERIRAGAPPQFGGVEDVWSPEHLLIAAALTCLKTTFDAYARHEQLVIDDWRGTATGVLAKGPGGPEFSAIDLAIEIRASPADVTRAESVLAIAARNCIVTRSLTAPVHVTGTVTAVADRATG